MPCKIWWSTRTNRSPDIRAAHNYHRRRIMPSDEGQHIWQNAIRQMPIGSSWWRHIRCGLWLCRHGCPCNIWWIWVKQWPHYFTLRLARPVLRITFVYSGSVNIKYSQNHPKRLYYKLCNHLSQAGGRKIGDHMQIEHIMWGRRAAWSPL